MVAVHVSTRHAEEPGYSLPDYSMGNMLWQAVNALMRPGKHYVDKALSGRQGRQVLLATVEALEAVST